MRVKASVKYWVISSIVLMIFITYSSEYIDPLSFIMEDILRKEEHILTKIIIIVVDNIIEIFLQRK